MTKRRIFLATAILLIFIAVFGAGFSAYASDAETRYADAHILSTYADEYIYYTSKEVPLDNMTDGRCPMYHNIAELTNSCGAIAGAEIVAFYDKYISDLIPDWVSYYTSSGKYRIQDSTNVPALIREMYTLMRTNVDDVGVSHNDFIGGLNSYIIGKGHQITYQSVRSGNAINLNQCKNAIDSNKVIVLFVAPCKIYNILQPDGYDIIEEYSISGAHIMVAYGYYQIKYYNESGLFRTDTYLRVSTGRYELPQAFYKTDSTTTEAAYIVNVQ